MLERELKLHVTSTFVLPSLDGVAGLRAAPAARRTQDATYWDTPDCRLLSQGVGLRWRSDAGWTVKSAVAGGGGDEPLSREERTVAGGPDSPPQALLGPLQQLIGPLPLAPIVRIRTDRVALELGASDGTPRVEVVDDRVRVLDGPLGGTSWRELELELRPGGTRSAGGAVGASGGEESDDAVLVALTARLREAGAGGVIRVAKHLRALGVTTETVPGSLEAHQLAGRVADRLSLGSVRAAGGVVLRRTGRADELVVVHRPHHGDWSLPKGKQEPGESLEATALREVEEESGLRCTLDLPLGCTAHPLGDGTTKVVWWWTMHQVAGELTAGTETDEVTWLQRDRARGILTHAGEQELIDRVP
ncbi:MAG: NUDIX domain-containing protein [Candidatus Dormibacteria bacterium]